MATIDFRSDTVTKPSAEMLEYMVNAPVGDDVYGEDPTVNELERFIAEYFGKEAAMYCASGTQANQIAINVHVKPGDEVICHAESHIYKYEGGGIAKNSGASVHLIPGNYGRMSAEQVKAAIQPDDVHFPNTALVCVEDTANRGGGAVYDENELDLIASVCQEHTIPLHLDGARMMNALVAKKSDPIKYAARFSSISLCLSKGLGAPVGSVLIGDTSFIKKARRVRKVMGGGMRQAGIIAAGGLYAFKNNVERLAQDHLHATLLGESFNRLPWVESVYPVQTNIVVVCLKEPQQKEAIIQLFKDNGVLISSFGEGMIRLVTHLDISKEEIETTISRLNKLAITV
jgi:threonine aldolase